MATTKDFTPYFGRLPNDPRQPRVRLTRLAGVGVETPPTADWISGVRTWGMLGNDSLGDCVAAGAGHAAMALSHYGSAKDYQVQTDDAITMYEAISGYRPSDPSTDVGATLQDGLSYWRSTGIAGHKIVAFAQLTVTDLEVIRACIATFGTVYTGMNFPSSAMDQFNAGQPWKTVRRSTIEGGHCVPIGAYTADTFTCVTWGQAQPMTVDFFGRYFDEVWVPITTEWIGGGDGTPVSPTGLDTDALNADYLALTGQAGPFAPAPPVHPDVDADVALAANMRTWLSQKGL